MLHHIDESPLQLEMIEIKSSHDLKNTHQEKGCTEFWTKYVVTEKYPNIKKKTD